MHLCNLNEFPLTIFLVFPTYFKKLCSSISNSFYRKYFFSIRGVQNQLRSCTAGDAMTQWRMTQWNIDADLPVLPAVENQFSSRHQSRQFAENCSLVFHLEFIHRLLQFCECALWFLCSVRYLTLVVFLRFERISTARFNFNCVQF